MARFRPKQASKRQRKNTQQKAPIKKALARANPFLKINEDEPTFDLIIPVSNGGFKDFPHRVSNLKLILEEIPPQIHVIMVEQIINAKLPTYQSQLEPRDNQTWLSLKSPVFNKSWLYNAGVRHAKTERLLFSEADVAIPKTYFPALLKWLQTHNYRWSIAWNRIIYWQPDKVRKKTTLRPSKGGPEGGVVFMLKSFFWNIGGYNEWMQRLGGIDNEIIRRAEALDRRSAYFPWTLDHLWHPFSEYKSNPSRERNKRIYRTVKCQPKRMIQILKRHISELGNEAPICAKRRATWLI